MTNRNRVIALLCCGLLGCCHAFDKTKTPVGNWYGDNVYFGYEYDMHANTNDVDLGASLSVDYLARILKMAQPDLLQTDTKGHEGLVSWHSKTPAASIAPGIVKEMVDYWVKAGNQLGIPCQAHYSGILDRAAGGKFPEWNAVDANGKPIVGKMCPRGPYVDKLLIPQAEELVDRYGVSALWVDGEIWAVVPCYCEKCTQAFRQKFGLNPPTSMDDPNWSKWIDFTRNSFQEYVAHYVHAIHRHNPETRVCSNWLHSFRNPGCPWVPTDYISGDNLGTLAHPNSACNARFMSTRGRPWEIVLWGFYYNEKSPWVMKPLNLMKQEASEIIALGGNINIYNQPKGHRDGRLVEWQMRRIGELADFVKTRKAVCQHSQTIPNAVVLHSEYDFYHQASSNIWEYETRHLEGALAALVDSSISTDIMDEWALLDQIDTFPLVVAPSQESMSSNAVVVLKEYVRNGGKLLVTGVGIYDALGPEFLGATNHAVNTAHSYHIPAGDERFPLSSHGHQGGAWTEVPVFPWREMIPVSARGIAPVTTTLFDEDRTPYFGATINQVGKGAVAYIPCDIMTYYYNSRYAPVRKFVDEVIAALHPDFPIEVQSPVAIEVVLRKKEGKTYVHLINRSSGLPLFENTRGADEIPSIGPVSIRIARLKRPESVRLLFESVALNWKYKEGDAGEAGTLSILVPAVHIHAVVEIY